MLIELSEDAAVLVAELLRPDADPNMLWAEPEVWDDVHQAFHGIKRAPVLEPDDPRTDTLPVHREVDE